MTIRTYARVGPYGKTIKSYFNDSTSSPRINGKLVLRAQGHTLSEGTVTAMSSNFAGNDCTTADSVEVWNWTSDQYNQTYAKFMGKLHKGGADLGVTLGSLGQTINMITDRCGKLQDFFSLRRVSRRKSRRKPKREDRFSREKLASDVLEGEFGWLPLVQDIHNALVSACQTLPSDWIRASSRFTRYDVNVSAGAPKFTTTVSGHGICTIAASVVITNPNLWLLNRLGLINPLTVAWDLVPWSFVVAMFVNINQLISCLSDTVGLTLSQQTVTYTSSLLREQVVVWKNALPGGGDRVSVMNVNCKRKNRTAGSIPLPSLQMKVPDFTPNLAVIASALVVQKVKAFH